MVERIDFTMQIYFRNSIMRYCIILLSCILFFACSEIEEIGESEVDIELQKQLNAHRGDWYYSTEPENSLAAFRNAIELPLEGVEFDVRTTRDGVMVICHDETFGEYDICTTDFNTLKNYKLPNGEFIPTLESFFNCYAQSESKIKMHVHIKDADKMKIIALAKQCKVLEFCIFAGSLKNAQFYIDNGLASQYVLSGNKDPSVALEYGFYAVNYPIEYLQENMYLIEEAKQLGVNILTSIYTDIPAIRKFASLGCIISTDRPRIKRL